MYRRLIPQRRVVWIAAIGATAAVFFVAGFALQAALGDSSGAVTPPAGSPTATATSPAITVTAQPPTSTPSLEVEPSSTAAAVAPAPRATVAPSPPPPQPTPDAAIQPAVSVTSLDPPLGAHIEQSSVNISIGVTYQAGSVSNVLSWYIRYCASPIDCNTFGSRVGAMGIVPRSSGRLTLGGVFPAGGNFYRPIVICQYTVEIGHFVTPEAQWQSDVSADPRCHPEVTGPRVKILDVTPPLGTQLHAGNTIAVNLEYDAVSATTIQAKYVVDGCALIAATARAVAPGTSGVTTVLIPVTAGGAGPLRYVEAQLLNGPTILATNSFGNCQFSPP